MKRVFILICLTVMFASSALAGDSLYIANPNPSDRLHLRAEPYEGAKSLGKYYNGAPIERTGFFNSFGWVEVTVGLGNNRSGYMKADFLSHEKQESAMPQYVAVQPVKAYQQPEHTSKTLTIAGGRLVSLMGFSENWWHLLVHTGESEGNYTCFVPVNASGLTPLDGEQAVYAYISNPDKTDRLHLRTMPDKDGKSLGKYYNGCAATILSFTEDAEWLLVDVYGQKGYMMADFLTVEGKTNHTWYGIPTVRTLHETKLFRNAYLNFEMQTVAKGTEIEILGVIDENVLHIRTGETTGFVSRTDVAAFE